MNERFLVQGFIEIGHQFFDDSYCFLVLLFVAGYGGWKKWILEIKILVEGDYRTIIWFGKLIALLIVQQTFVTQRR